MRVPKTKIEAAISQTKSRYTLQSVIFDVPNERLVATDGHILAVVPQKPDKGDEFGLIPLRAFDVIRHSDDPAIIQSKKQVVVKLETEEHIFVAEEAHLPKYESILPKPTDTYKHIVTLDAELLVRLALAITDIDCQTGRLVKLYINGPNDAVVVRPYVGDEKQFGLIMPVRTQV